MTLRGRAASEYDAFIIRAKFLYTNASLPETSHARDNLELTLRKLPKNFRLALVTGHLLFM